MQNHEIPKSKTIHRWQATPVDATVQVGWNLDQKALGSQQAWARIQGRKAARTLLTTGSPNRCSLGYPHLGRCQGPREVLRVPGPLTEKELPWTRIGSSKLEDTETTEADKSGGGKQNQEATGRKTSSFERESSKWSSEKLQEGTLGSSSFKKAYGFHIKMSTE